MQQNKAVFCLFQIWNYNYITGSGDTIRYDRRD